MKDNSHVENASSYFKKLMKQKYISKSEILSLKKKFKVLKENSSTTLYNNMLNRITRVSEKAIGKNSPEILQEIFDDFTLMMKPKLKELGSPSLSPKATLQRFRACVIIDSCMYQIGEDTPDRNLALEYCNEYCSEMQPVQIFDDKGDPHIIDGQLKKMYRFQRVSC